MEVQPNGRSISIASQSPIVNDDITPVITSVITPDIIIKNSKNHEDLFECNDAGFDKHSRSDSTEPISNNGRSTEECNKEEVTYRKLIRSLLKRQVEELQPSEKEAFRRKNYKRAELKITHARRQLAENVDPNMFKSTTSSITGAANDISQLVEETRETRVKVDETISTVNDVAAKIKELASDGRADQLLESANSFVSKMKESADKLGDFVTEITRMITLPDLARFGLIAATTVAQICMVRKHTIIFLLLEVVKVCAYLVPSDITKDLKNISEFVQTKFAVVKEKFRGRKQAQNGHEEVDSNYDRETNKEGMMKSFVYKITALLTGTSESETRKLGALKTIGDLGRSLTNINLGATTLIKWAIWLFDSIHMLVARVVGKMLLPSGEITKFNSDFCDLLEVDPENYGKNNYAEKFFDLRTKALELKRRIESGELKLNKAVNMIVTKNIDKVLKHYDEHRMAILALKTQIKTRRTPYCMQFVGLPGKGKSTVMKLTGLLLTRYSNCGVDYGDTDLIYNVSNTSYMDGYRMQPVHLHDDMWQAQDGVDQGKSEYLHFINCISNVAFQVDMAALATKGMPYTCDLYIGSTNNPYPTPANIVKKEAITRRRNKVILVYSTNWHNGRPLFDEDYGDEGDYEQLNHMAFRFLDIEGDNWNKYSNDLDIALRTNGRIDPGWMSYREMMKIVSDDFRRHLKQADPKWIDGTNPPAALQNLSADPPRRPRSERQLGQALIAGNYARQEQPEPPAEQGAPVAQANAPPTAANPATGAIPKKRTTLLPNPPAGTTVRLTETQLRHYAAVEPEKVSPNYLSDNEDIHDHILGIRLTETTGYARHEVEVANDFHERFMDDRDTHEQSFVVCSDDCDEHPFICCTEMAYHCTGQDDVIRHYCGKYGFYSTYEDDCTFINMDDDDFEDPLSLNYERKLLLAERGIDLPRSFSSHDELDIEEVDSNMERETSDSESEGGLFSFLKSPKAKITSYREVRRPTLNKKSVKKGYSTFNSNDWNMGPMNDESVETNTELIGEFLNEKDEEKTSTLFTTLKVAAGVLAVCAAIGSMAWAFKIYRERTREPTPAEEIAETLTEVLDTVHENKHIPKAAKAQIADSLIRAQAEANGSYYESGVPSKGPSSRYAQARPLKVSQNSGSYRTLSERIKSMDDNLVKVRSTRYNDPTETIRICGLGIYGKNLLINAHFIEKCAYDEANKETLLDIHRFGEWSSVRIPWTNMVAFKEHDIVIVQLPGGHKSFKDIRKYFCENKNFSVFGGEMTMTALDKNGGRIAYSAPYKMRGTPISYENDSYVLADALRYMVHADMHGMCSAPVWDVQTCSIVGLHIANSFQSEEKFAMVVSRELIEEICSEATKQFGKTDFVDKTEKDVVPLIVESNGGSIRTRGTVEKYGLATAEACQHTVGKTKIRKSPIFGVFENQHEPAVLSMKDKRISPEARLGETIHEKGVSKYSTPIVPWKGKHRENITQVIAAKLSGQKHKLEMRLLNDHEVLNGTEDGALKEIDMKASAGWPWVKRKPASVIGKLNIFENTSPEGEKKNWIWKDNEQARQVKERMDFLETEFRQGRNAFWLAYSNIKDELRSFKKIAEANSRSFDCVPIEVTLLFRKYFGMFIAQTHLNCADMPISVGIDPLTQWTRLAERLLSKGDAMIAGDYKNWDGSVSAEELYDATADINAFYNDSTENQNVRHLLVYGATHMWLAVGDTIVRKHQGLPSGIPLTAVLNSLINWRRLSCCIQEIYENETGRNLTVDELYDNVDMLLYGDDHVVAMSQDIRNHVNFMKVKETFAQHNITYTDSRKLGNDFEFEKLSETTYLKRTFVRYAQIKFIGPLDLTSVLKSANWLHENKRISRMDMLACIKNSLQDELALHGRAIYQDCVKRYNAAIESERIFYPEPEIDPRIISSFDNVEERIRERLGLEHFACKTRNSVENPLSSIFRGASIYQQQ